MQALVLAGGQGTRLWPLSRSETPKQLLSPLNDEKNLLLQTVDRILAQGIPAENIHLVTTAAQAPLFEKIWKGFGGIVAESAAKNTGPAVLLGLKYLQSRGLSSLEPVAVFASDHYISDFHFDTALDCSRRIFCFTLKPTRAETGYGYIQLKAESGPARKVQAFKEKPDAPTAEAWLKAWADNPQDPDNKFWNSGVYVFSVQSLSPVLEKSSPDVYRLWSGSSYESLCARYGEFPKIPFDILVAEKADNLYALPLPCSKWRDIGTWKSVHEALSASPGSNAAAGKADILAAGSAGNLAFSTQKKLIAFAGVQNLAVIDTGDALLVADKDNAEAMKALLDILAQKKSEYT